MKNKDGIEDYIVYVPKHFEEAEKTSPKVKKFVEAYKAFYKRDFPYDQAPLCSSSCYDHVYMLVAAMQKAGTVEDVGKIRAALLSFTYSGMWTIKFDPTRRADLRLRHRASEEGRRHPDHARRALICSRTCSGMQIEGPGLSICNCSRLPQALRLRCHDSDR